MVFAYTGINVCWQGSFGYSDFTNKMPIKQKDEVGLLSIALNNMVTNLGRMFREINNGSYTLSASSSNLSSISDNMKQGAETTSIRASTVAAAGELMSYNMEMVTTESEQTANNVNMVAAAAEEMSATINEIATIAAHFKFKLASLLPRSIDL